MTTTRKDTKNAAKIKAIIFDFDGVIVESVQVKAEAFRRLFLQYPKQLDRIMDYHMENGGISRFKKFKHIYKEFLKEKLSEEKSEELGRLFTEYAYRGVVLSPFVRGAEEFLEKYYKRLKLFIVSGTPEEELDDIIKERKMGHYFSGVYGTPRTKGELSRLILRENGLKKQGTMFVGDSINDYHGAREAGIRFSGRVHKGLEHPFQGIKRIDLIRDIKELERLLKKESLL